MRDIKTHKESISTITSRLDQQKDMINDSRRLNQMFLREMVRHRDVNVQKRRVNDIIEKSVERSRSLVGEMLGAYKDGVSKSVGLRRTILTEVNMANRSSMSRIATGKLNVNDVLPKIEDWEMRSRDLLKHRIKTRIVANRTRATLIANYVQRMEDFDQGLCDIKERESVPELEEILSVFERVESKRADLGERMVGISVESDQLNAKNNALTRENNEATAIIAEFEEFNDIHCSLHEQKDQRIDNKLKSIRKESSFLDEEFLDFKDIVYESFLYWEVTNLGQTVPVSKDMVQKEFIQLGAFNP
jgi:predicted esterase YcpF (UPF0227 family)